MSTPFFLQAPPVKRNLINVELDALVVASDNGHKMGKWVNNWHRKRQPVADYSASTCVVCGASAVASTNPPPMATKAFGGRATVENCK